MFELEFFDELRFALIDDLCVLARSLRTERVDDSDLIFGLQFGDIQQERFAAQCGDLGGNLIDVAGHTGNIWKDAGALLQVQRPQPLQIAPDGHPFARGFGRYTVDQHPPAQRHTTLDRARWSPGSHSSSLRPQTPVD